MNTLVKTAVVSSLCIGTQAYALNDGFNFDECSGSGSFEQQINHYGGDYENAIEVGEIPAGIQGLRITLESDNDVDIRLLAGSDKIVHWPYGLLNRSTEEETAFEGTKVTYSGYNGVEGEKGHEFIEVDGTVPRTMTMQAFGYKSGHARVNYSWTGTEGCEAGTGTGDGTFTQELHKKQTVMVGRIPSGIKDLRVALASDNDLDIQLYGEDGTAIVAWPGGLLSGDKIQELEHNGVKIEWSGYNGDGTGKGHEYIKITGRTNEILTMKAYGYESGLAEVSYSWDANSTKEDNNNTADDINTDNNQTNHKDNNTTDSAKTSGTKAYFGDKENNLIVVVDVDNMKVVEKIATGHDVTYAAEAIKTKVSGDKGVEKFYIDNRGSNVIDVLDASTNTIVKSIALPFHPRSIDVNKHTGLVAVSGADKTMEAVIDSKTDTLLLTVGEDTPTASTGHPKWLNDDHFVLLDRENSKIMTYQIKKESNEWKAMLVNTLETNSPVHNLIPPEVHGQKGVKHGEKLSTIFYATEEGTSTLNGAVLKLEFLNGVGLTLLETLEIAPLPEMELDASQTGVHHHNFLADQKTIYVGSKEGTLTVINYALPTMQIVKTIDAGKGAGHTAEFKQKNIAVVINHTDKFITLMDTKTDTKIADIMVSNISEDEVGLVQTQSHPEYHFSKDGKYFYLFLTEEGALVKVDLEAKKVVERLEIGGHLSMGSFVNN